MSIKTSGAIGMVCLMALAACDRAGMPTTGSGGQTVDIAPSSARGSSPLHATYWVDNHAVFLHEGYAERLVSTSGLRERTWVLEGSQVHGDLDGDGDDDVALVLVHEPGGSGTFNYLAVALQIRGRRYDGSVALLLGDRIERPVITIRDGLIQVRFLDRPEGTPFTEAPTRSRVVRARLVGRQLEELSAAVSVR